MNKKVNNIRNRKPLASKILVVLLPFLLATTVLAVSETFTGKCVSVHDGDTIGVMHNGKEEKIRVYGIDCPELHQDFGSRAKQFTSNLVFGKTVSVEAKSHDRYGRTVGRVKVDGKDLSLELAKAGMAWYYKKYTKDPALAKAEKDARSNKLGLWSTSNPTAPWDFRRNKGNKIRISEPKPIKSIAPIPAIKAVKIDTVDTPDGKRIIYTGPHGGKYYLNKKGKKVYMDN